MPLVMVVLFLLLYFILKKQPWKNRSLKTAAILLLIFSNEFIANEVALLWEIPATPFKSITKKYEYGILLTGVTKGKMIPDDRVYLTRGADRIYHTVQLYKLGIISKIVVSGGSGDLVEKRRPEALDFLDVLKIMGVPEQDILLESNSRNTHESSAKVILLYGKIVDPAKSLLITSGYHMRRSYNCFAKQGWRLDTFSADFISHPRRFTLAEILIPQTDAIATWQILLREWAGMIAYKMAGYV